MTATPALVHNGIFPRVTSKQIPNGIFLLICLACKFQSQREYRQKQKRLPIARSVEDGHIGPPFPEASRRDKPQDLRFGSGSPAKSPASDRLPDAFSQGSPADMTRHGFSLRYLRL
ncbi:hypothetical protein Trco_003516 [Trichoderma cornu-damae]|uniref:Uncharacterized protein n=1 Tax=Trichoderma cornu-damae TaxID=654480 RepID=A0A9P8QQ72_9HYPO|nr:hypothetical protein Trco_003516 [Trichoderma cornu-damae]